MRILVLIRVSFHVPYDLMGEELREFCRLDYIPLDVSKGIISQCLHDLGDVEESDINRVTFERTHCILENVWMVAICG